MKAEHLAGLPGQFRWWTGPTAAPRVPRKSTGCVHQVLVARSTGERAVVLEALRRGFG